MCDLCTLIQKTHQAIGYHTESGIILSQEVHRKVQTREINHPMWEHMGQWPPSPLGPSWDNRCVGNNRCDVSHTCRCHWERWRASRVAYVSFHIVFSMNDTGILVAGRLRSEDRTSDERAKPGVSFFLNRRLTARLVAASKIRVIMRGLTIEFGGVASIRMLKYAWATSGSTMALKRTRSR
jgi:hypothetical protein